MNVYKCWQDSLEFCLRHKRLLCALLLVLSPLPVYGQTVIPIPTGHQVATDDPNIKNLTWEHWKTENFSVLSVDLAQGEYVKDNIEKMKTWTLARWGLSDVKFSGECRVLCVTDRTLMKKLFGLEDSYGEIRRDASGKIKLSVMWLILDGKPAEKIPSALTSVCLAEWAQQNTKLGFWAYRGMSILNGTIPQIKEKLSGGPMQKTLVGDQPIFTSSQMFAMTEEEYVKMSKEHQRLFDNQAAYICLLLRKELGEDSLHKFLKAGASEGTLTSVYGFGGYSEFDSTMKRYMKYLSSDLQADKTPMSYLNITPRR